MTANASNSLRARQIDTAGNPSPCSGTFTYVEDSVAPDAPSITGTLPASPSQDATAHGQRRGHAGLVVRVYTTACTGTPLGSGTADGSGDAVIAAHDPAERGAEQPARRHVDAAGNRSSCSDVFPYVLDTTEPAAPVLSATVPDSPSTDNTPGIRGTATEGDRAAATRARAAAARRCDRHARPARGAPPGSRRRRSSTARR